MIALLALIVALAGYVAYDLGKAARRALDARPRDRHGLLRRRPRYDDHARIHARDYAPARDRSLDASSPVCEHPARPVAVVPAMHDAPVGWVCPDCLADRPEPPPLGPDLWAATTFYSRASDPPHATAAGDVWHQTDDGRTLHAAAPGATSWREVSDTGRFTAGTIRADRITAGTITPAPSLADERRSIRQALDHAEERATALLYDLKHDDDGNFTVTKDQYRAYSAACASVKELRALLAATPEPRPGTDVYEVYSHQSATPVRTITTGPASITYAAIADAFDVPPALLGSPGTYANAADDFRRSNLIALMREAGHSAAYIAEHLAEWDRRQTTAEPVRALTPTGEPAASAAVTFPHV